MVLTSLGRKRRYSDQVKVLYVIFWLCFNQWEFCHKYNTAKISQCVLNAHVIPVQMWPRCSSRGAQAHPSGRDCATLLASGLWEDGVVAVRGRSQHELLKLILPVSIPALSHSRWERCWGGQNSCCPCLPENRATCLFSCLNLLALCHKRILLNSLWSRKTGAAPGASREGLASYKGYCIYAMDVFLWF